MGTGRNKKGTENATVQEKRVEVTTAKAEHIKDDTPVTGEKVQPRLMLWMGIFLSGICLFLSDGKKKSRKRGREN